MTALLGPVPGISFCPPWVFPISALAPPSTWVFMLEGWAPRAPLPSVPIGCHFSYNIHLPSIPVSCVLLWASLSILDILCLCGQHGYCAQSSPLVLASLVQVYLLFSVMKHSGPQIGDLPYRPKLLKTPKNIYYVFYIYPYLQYWTIKHETVLKYVLRNSLKIIIMTLFC